ncbi:uncharacterized protein RJT21DRAFT_114676 [Scheffersomyces amazonensis]|uniref:uncharacterized protein n=1 Tax=Scheffersomyces amazonensis TaxID=1078765 RepID=UPI00315C4DA1
MSVTVNKSTTILRSSSSRITTLLPDLLHYYSFTHAMKEKTNWYFYTISTTLNFFYNILWNLFLLYIHNIDGFSCFDPSIAVPSDAIFTVLLFYLSFKVDALPFLFCLIFFPFSSFPFLDFVSLTRTICLCFF